MRIVITRSGGFGGLTRTWSLEVSRSEAEERWLPLAEAEGAEVEGAEVESVPQAGAGATGSRDAEATGPGSRPASAAPSAQRDRFTYRIAIGYTEVYLPESALDEAWRELIERARAATSERQTDPKKATGEGAGAGTADPGHSPELL